MMQWLEQLYHYIWKTVPYGGISLEDDVKGDYDALKEAFQRRFEPDPRTKWQRTAELYSILQNQSTVEDFIAKITTKAAELQLWTNIQYYSKWTQTMY